MDKIIPFIGAEIAKEIDQELMSTFAYSIDQLMEVAGLSVATIIKDNFKYKKVLTICGPGNNGGDGLVASRYLKEFDSEAQVDILYPKQGKNEIYERLKKQCESYKVNFKEIDVINNFTEYDLILDAVFGFSFKGEIRAPFGDVVNKMKAYQDKIVSIDIPSGWDVEKGNINNTFVPQCLISLTLPKKCAEQFKGEHYLGGRFVPKDLFSKFSLSMKSEIYESSKLYVKL